MKLESMPKGGQQTYEKDGRIYDVAKLIRIVGGREAKEYPLEFFQPPSKSRRDGFSKYRYEDTDLQYPILIREDGYIIDGRHRFLKSRDQGKKKIKAIIVKEKDMRDVEYVDKKAFMRGMMEATI